MARKTGTKPKPTRLRVLHGDQKHRINFAEPVPPEGEITMPADLTERAQRVWSELAPSLRAMGVLTVVDVAALAVLCESLALFRTSAVITNTSSVLVKGRGEELKRNPAIIPMMQSARTASMLMAEFGMTPSARSRLTDPSRVQADERDRLLS